MKYIVISGIDGSGKTTIIQLLGKKLSKKGVKSSYLWLRFNHYSTKILHGVARFLNLSVKVQRGKDYVWEHRFYNSKLFSNVYIFFTLIDTYISRIRLRVKKVKGADVIICDRWIPDILVDLSVKTRKKDFFDSSWYKAFLFLIPAHTQIFIINRLKEHLVNCRYENLTDPDFELRFEQYRLLSCKSFVITVENDGSPEEAAEKIIKFLAI